MFAGDLDGGARFACESGYSVAVLQHGRKQELDRDLRVELQVASGCTTTPMPPAPRTRSTRYLPARTSPSRTPADHCGSLPLHEAARPSATRSPKRVPPANPARVASHPALHSPASSAGDPPFLRYFHVGRRGVSGRLPEQMTMDNKNRHTRARVSAPSTTADNRCSKLVVVLATAPVRTAKHGSDGCAYTPSAPPPV